jgi:hypothetical protein
MKTNWRRHLIICLVLGLLAIPVYLVALAFAGSGGGGNWITLSFRGLIIGAYGAWFAIQLVLTTVGIRVFPRAGARRIHLCAVIPSVVLLVVGTLAYVKLADRAQANQVLAAQERRRPLADVIELKEWSYSPDDIHPTEIRVNVMVHAAGRFAGNVHGETSDASGSSRSVFQSVNDPSSQRQVRKDEAFTYVFPLEILQPGQATDVRITLYLFDTNVDPTVRDISKVFMNSPNREDDGQYFYGILPPPTPR